MTDVNISLSANFSYDYTSTEDVILRTVTFKVLVYVFFSSFAIIGVVSNVLTIIVFTRGPRSSVRDIRILMLNRAVINLLYAISTPIPSALDFTGFSFPDNEVICKLYRFTSELSSYGSPLANLSIAIERLVIVYSTARTLGLRNRKVVMYIIIGCFWVFKLAVTVELLSESYIFRHGDTILCIPDYWLAEDHHVLYNWLLIVKFSVPAILIMVLYTIIGFKMTICSDPVGNISIEPQLMRRAKQRKKMVKMLTIVAIITLVAYLPYNLYTISYEYEDPLDNYFKASYYLDISLFGLQLTNGFTSPIVYMVFDRYFKRDLRDMFGFCAFVSRSATSQPTQTTTTARTIRGNGGGGAGANQNRSVATVMEPETTIVPDIRPRPKSKKKKASERTWLKSSAPQTSNAR